MKNKQILYEMLMIFGNPRKDWMGYKYSKKNYISYHHILEKRNDGIESIDNGALLSRTSHILLHKIESENYDLYLKWQQLFIEINLSRKPLDDYFYAKIAGLRKETKEFFASLNNNKLNHITLKLN